MAAPIQDGQLSFDGGQDASLPPSRLPENKIAAGINIRTSKGVIGPRFAYERKKLQFPPGGYSYVFNKIANFEQLFYTGKFQAQAPYKIGQRSYSVVVISGVIFLIDINTYIVKVLTLNKNTQLNEASSRINWAAAGRYLVLHDFPSRPIFVEGQTARRSSAEAAELPASNLGIYNQSRYFYSNFGNEFTAGDPVGSRATPNAPITTFETTLDGSDFKSDVYQMPSKFNSPITAMATLQATDSATGIGQMIAASPTEIFAYNTVQPRSTWLQGQFARSLSDNAGIVGARAFTNVNSDLFFVSGDGQLRSLSVAQQEQKKWARVPMDVEVQNWVNYIDKELIPYTVVNYFKNNIFWSVRPYRIISRRLDGSPILDVAHSGFVVLNTANVSRLGTDSAPAWEGLWTGIRPLDMCVIDERMFVMSKDYYSRNGFYEVDPELKYDRNEVGTRRQIVSTVYAREHFFQNAFTTKDLNNVEVGITDIEGDFSLDIDFKPSHCAKFLDWAEFHHEAPIEYTSIFNGNIAERTSLSFRELKFGAPSIEEANPVTKDGSNKVKRVQFRFKIQGDNWKFNEYLIDADVVPESRSEYLHDLPTVPILKECYSDWTYEEFGIAIDQPLFDPNSCEKDTGS